MALPPVPAIERAIHQTAFGAYFAHHEGGHGPLSFPTEHVASLFVAAVQPQFDDIVLLQQNGRFVSMRWL